jgi:hypothetical protein
MKTPRFVLLSLFILSLSLVTLGQEVISKKDITDWIYFSPLNNQIKKIDQDRFFSYYRTSLDNAGFIVFDNKLNVLKDISFKLKINKKDFVDYLSSYADYSIHPIYYYQSETNSIVLIISKKSDNKKKKGTLILGLRYSLDNSSLADTDTLTTIASDNFGISQSANEKYILISEFQKSDGKGKDPINHEYEVFNNKCEKQYLVNERLPDDSDIGVRINNNGELYISELSENKKIFSLKLSKYDNIGKVVGISTYSFPKNEVVSYKCDGIVNYLDKECCVLTKVYDDVLVGIIILNVDYSNNKVQKATDYKIDKNVLSKAYQSVIPTHILNKNKKVKPLNELKNFTLEKAFADKSGLYIVTNNMETKSYLAQQCFETQIISNDLIVWHFDFEGNIKWVRPIIKSSKLITTNINTYIPFFSGKVSQFNMDENYIHFIVLSDNHLYASRIDKTTGNDSMPISLFSEKEYTINKNLVFYFNPNNAVIATMEGVILAFNKKTVTLQSVDLNYK